MRTDFRPGGIFRTGKAFAVLRAVGAVAVAFSISACVPAVTPASEAGAAGPWEVSFELSGGIAGAMKQIVVSNDGRLIGENLKRRTRIEKRLSADQVKELDRLIGQAESAPAPADSPSRCADCIEYRLTVSRSGGRPTVFESGFVGQRQSRSGELLRFLAAILNEAVP